VVPDFLLEDIMVIMSDLEVEQAQQTAQRPHKRDWFPAYMQGIIRGISRPSWLVYEKGKFVSYGYNSFGKVVRRQE
jgi:hypothetical protein